MIKTILKVTLIALALITAFIIFSPHNRPQDAPSKADIEKQNTDVEDQTVQRAEQEVGTITRDPVKSRWLECMNINVWTEKPTGWVPPTVEECKLIGQKLGMTPDEIEYVTSRLQTFSSADEH